MWKETEDRRIIWLTYRGDNHLYIYHTLSPFSPFLVIKRSSRSAINQSPPPFSSAMWSPLVLSTLVGLYTTSSLAGGYINSCWDVDMGYRDLWAYCSTGGEGSPAQYSQVDLNTYFGNSGGTLVVSTCVHSSIASISL